MPPRFVPHLPLPPYTYVPGKAPHPLSDASGHSFGKHAPPYPPLDETNWPEHEAYLYGLDLFNLGYYWEAHEAWESAWHGVGRQGAIADLLKGLIHLTAAGVKLREGQPTGVASHLRKAEGLFARVLGQMAVCLGLLPEKLIDDARQTIGRPPALCDEPPSVVRPLFSFSIWPEANA